MNINIKNKIAFFNYHILETYISGMQLKGSEIKSIRNSDVSIKEAYCYIYKEEMFVQNMHIAEYKQSSYNNHQAIRIRKLLLNKKEIIKLKKKMKTKGITIIPLKLFINKKGWAKLEIGLAKGKKLYDKREAIKKREAKIEIGRFIKK